jgi:hypothetical protein
MTDAQRAETMRKISQLLIEVNKQNKPFPYKPGQWDTKDGQPYVLPN